MSAYFFRLWIIVLMLTTNAAFSQLYPDGLSNAIIETGSAKIPVKVFATADLSDFQKFPTLNVQNSLVILGQDNLEQGNESRDNYNNHTVDLYYKNGYESYNKNWEKEDQIQKIRYFLKTDKKINSEEKIHLQTNYKIWNPTKGLSLGKLTLHFYSLMFILAFGLGYILMTRIFKTDHVNLKYLDPLFTWTLVGTILGARLGHVIFYQPELFREDFWSVFLPIQTKPEFKFTGFSGLASHGATIMLIFTTLYYAFKIIKKNPLWVYDRLGIVVALGGGFVRLGNFFNSEIIGKQVAETSPFAILFPQMSDEYGITVPRYPTQLFEAAGYFLLFLLLWILYKKTNKKYQQGWLFGLFFILLWAIRFFVEFLKEPQGNEYISFAGLNTGQVLSIPFMLAGLVIMLISPKYKITEEENQKPD